MATTLNDMTIKNLKAGDKEFTRREKGGFGIRVHPTGTKTFFYMYRVDGKRKFLNLGEYRDRQHPSGTTLEDARAQFIMEKGKVTALKAGRAEGQDPVKHKKDESNKRISESEDRDSAPTVSDLIADYIRLHAMPKKRSWAMDKAILELDALPAWGNLKAADIKKRHVVALLGKIVERGAPGSANNNFKVLRKMFNWAVEQDILETTPCLGVKMPANNDPKDRKLSDTEIKTFWNSIDKCAISNEIKRALKLILVTAQRPGEVIGMHSREIDGKWWTIPAERSKNKREHSVYLTDTALELIGPLTKVDPEAKKTVNFGYFFRCPHISKDKPISVNALSYALRRNLKGRKETRDKVVKRKGEAYKRGPYNSKGTASTDTNLLGTDSFTPHDLRRTANTLMAASKIIKEYRERVLNHTLEKLDGTYNLHDYDDEKQMALEALERKINSIICEKEGGKVIAIGIKKAA